MNTLTWTSQLMVIVIDMFLSPPPLELDPLSKELTIPEHISDRVEQETGK